MPEKKIIVVSTIEGKFQQHFDIIKDIGSGSFSTVLLVRQRFGKRQNRAVKQIRINPCQDSSEEIQKMKLLRADHIIEFYGYMIQEDYLYIVMNFCKMSLKDQIDSYVKQRISFSPSFVLSLIVQITSGMLKLNQKNILHLDLKPQNILLEDDGYYKLCDFGCSQLLANCSLMVSTGKIQTNDFSFGTPQYIAPEIQLGMNERTKSSCDIWSTGIILYNLIYGKHPFNLNQRQKVQTQQFKDFLSGKYQILFPSKPGYPIDLLKMMLKSDLNMRPTWKQVKKHLIINFSCQQAEFIDLQDAANMHISGLLVIGNICQLITNQIEQQKEQFWKNNKEILNKLRITLQIIAYLETVKFDKLFKHKMDKKLTSQKYNSLLFMLQNFKQQSITNHTNLTYSKQILSTHWNLMKQHIKSLNLIIKTSKTQNDSLQKLACFLSETQQTQNFFCAGNNFNKTKLFFEIYDEEQD